MENSTFATLKKPLATLILCSIVSLFLLCLIMPFMEMAKMDSDSPCGMNHATELCPMTLNDQLGFWHKVLVPLSTNLSLLASLIILVVVAIALHDAATLEALRRLRLLRYHADASPSLVDYLRQQFSQGILHPKIY